MTGDYINKQGTSKLSDKNLSSLMYALVICKAKLLGSFGVGIYDLSRQENSRHSYDFIISINKDKITKFEDITGIVLKDLPIVGV